jgi:hypothetical protein
MAIFRSFLIHSILSYCTLSVTVIPLALNLPKPYPNDVVPVASDHDLLVKIAPGLELNGQKHHVATSSYSYGPWSNGINKTSGLYAGQDSFVRGAIDASARQQHLVLRPDDVWYTILTQLGFYLRKHKDDQTVRGIWDNFDGRPLPKNNGWVWIAGGMDYVLNMVFKQRSKANWLSDWVRPTITSLPSRPMNTNSSGYEMMANSVFMASSTPSTEDIQPFGCGIGDGFPSVTLLGTKAEWIEIADKLTEVEKIVFGSEPALYALSLRPIITRFIATFNTPYDPAIRLFWSDMVTATPQRPLCHTTDIVTGWINGFHFWDGAGNLLFSTIRGSTNNNNNNTVQLDNITYPWRKTKDMPTALSEITLCTSGDTMWEGYEHILVGMMAKTIKKGIPDDYGTAMKMAGFILPPTVTDSDHSILQPQPAWISHFKVESVSQLSSHPLCNDYVVALLTNISRTEGLRLGRAVIIKLGTIANSLFVLNLVSSIIDFFSIVYTIINKVFLQLVRKKRKAGLFDLVSMTTRSFGCVVYITLFDLASRKNDESAIGILLGPHLVPIAVFVLFGILCGDQFSRIFCNWRLKDKRGFPD